MRIDQFESKEAAIAHIQETVYGCKQVSEAEKYLRRNLPKESYYQSAIINYLKERYPDAFVWKATAGPYSRGGVPDVIAVIDGKFFGFEVKRPYIGKPSKLQLDAIKKIKAAGGYAGIVCFPEDAEQIIERSRKR